MLKRENNEEYNATGYSDGQIKEGHKSYKEDRKYDDIKGTNDKYYRTDKYDKDVVIGDPKKVMIANYCNDSKDSHLSQSSVSNGTVKQIKKDKLEETDGFDDTFAANDRWAETIKSNMEATVIPANNKFDYSKGSFSKGADTFKLSETGGTVISSLSLADSKAQTVKTIHKAVSYDDRKIVASGRYDPEEYYYNYELYQSDEFEEDEDCATPGSTIVEAEKDEQELTCILHNYKKYANNEKHDSSSEDEEFIKHQDILNEESKKLEDIPIYETAKLQINNCKAQIQNTLGKKLYDKVYKYLKAEREKQTEETKVMKKLHKMIPKDGTILTKCFELDQIIYMEIMRGE